MTGAREPWARLGPAGEWLLPVLLAVALLPAGLDAIRDGGLAPGAEWFLGGTLLVLHAAAFPPLARRPLAAYGLASAAMLALVAGPTLTTAAAGAPASSYPPVLLPSGLVWFVVLYAVSARTSPPWPGRALVVGAAGCVLTVARLWELADAAPGGPLAGRLLLAAGVTAGTVGAWALGRYRATRRAWQDAAVERAAAEERRRIAREMHDVVAHSLAVVVAHAEGGRLLVQTRPERAPEVLDEIATSGRRALAEMRDLLGVLREPAPGAQQGPGAPRPPQPSLDGVPDLLDSVRAAGLPVELVERGDRRDLGGTRELAAYRVVQESLTNAVRHAGSGARARVELDWGDGLVVTVTDTGVGSESGGTATTRGGGRGLAGLRERVEAVGGSFEAGPTERGWRTCARIPA